MDLYRAEPTPALNTTPLVIDLDGTLVNGDVLHECALGLAGGRPHLLLALPVWLAAGKAHLKARLASLSPIDPALLCYNEVVLNLARSAAASGRPVYLATATDRSMAEAVAAHLGCFSGVFASDGTINLSGEAKATSLVAAFGSGGFDYVGNSADDLPVWALARRALAPHEIRSVARRARGMSLDLIHLGPRPEPVVLPLLRALRPHQWLKNLLVFLPPIAGHDLSPHAASSAFFAFFAFCLAASAGYLINDLLDLQSDRAHPRKRQRPFAAGAIPPIVGVLVVPLLLVGAALLCLLLPLVFALVLLAYFFASAIYSSVLKRLILIDVLALSGLYVVRVAGGSLATGIMISHWLFVFSMFLFLSLALVKRVVEIGGRLQAGDELVPGRGYRVQDLPVLQQLAVGASFSAALVMGLYINSDAASALYGHPWALWLLCPLLVLWLARIHLLANRGDLHDDPVVFAATDQCSLLLGAFCFVVLMAAA